MTQATVYYLKLTDEMVEEINTNGWSCPTGKAYMDAKMGLVETADPAAYEKVATVDIDDAEQAWIALQNVLDNFEMRDRTFVEVFVREPNRRSMDVGDIVVWDDGTAERVDSVGFDPITWPGE